MQIKMSLLDSVHPNWLCNWFDLIILVQLHQGMRQMEVSHLAKTIAGFGMVLLGSVHAAMAEKIEANCTGMIDFDIYTIDTEEPIQDIALIGTSSVAIDDEFIILTGDFGEYKFDLNRGTLYRDGSDTGIYCTYSRKPG